MSASAEYTEGSDDSSTRKPSPFANPVYEDLCRPWRVNTGPMKTLVWRWKTAKLAFRYEPRSVDCGAVICT